MSKILSFLRLINTPGVGPISFYRLIERHNNVCQALEHLKREKPSLQIPSEDQMAREISLCESKGVSIISYEDNLYPSQLRTIPDAPPILYVLGNIDLLTANQILGVVGARNSSLNARNLVKRWSAKVREADIGLISGFALGIDKAMHDGALKLGSIGVFACGLNHVYPQEHQGYLAEFLKTGTVISEQPMETPPLQKLFPRRNRIIAGISQALLVVEAARQSGALITANCGAEYGRDIGVVPGFPLDPRSIGGNHLLKEGASLITCEQDILDMFGSRSSIEKHEMTSQDKPDIACEISAKKILDALGDIPLSIDMLIQSMRLDAHRVNEILMELELDERITRLPGNKVALRL